MSSSGQPRNDEGVTLAPVGARSRLRLESRLRSHDKVTAPSRRPDVKNA